MKEDSFSPLTLCSGAHLTYQIEACVAKCLLSIPGGKERHMLELDLNMNILKSRRPSTIPYYWKLPLFNDRTPTKY